MAKKFFKNQTKDFESEIEFIENLFGIISENYWNIDDSFKAKEIYSTNKEGLKKHFEFGNKLDFLKFIRMSSDIKKSLIKMKKLNENFLQVLKEFYSPFKNLLEKLNRSSRIFNKYFEDEGEDVDKLSKFYNGPGSKQLNKISYSLK